MRARRCRQDAQLHAHVLGKADLALGFNIRAGATPEPRTSKPSTPKPSTAIPSTLRRDSKASTPRTSTSTRRPTTDAPHVTPSTPQAYAFALSQNNKWELDGRGPNAFAGIAWCFGHADRPFPERKIFGPVRAMTASGLVTKFGKVPSQSSPEPETRNPNLTLVAKSGQVVCACSAQGVWSRVWCRPESGVGGWGLRVEGWGLSRGRSRALRQPKTLNCDLQTQNTHPGPGTPTRTPNPKP